jgi:thioester reductase-like protein
MRRRLLVTGADGYVGRLLVEHYLANTDRSLLLWTRAGDTASALARMDGAVTTDDLTQGRVRFAGGDLREAAPFAGVDPCEVGAIVHLAAVTSFTVDRAAAAAVHRDGTARVLDLAKTCPGLESVCLASTIYASGLTSGVVPEGRLDRPPDFANEYERSKWEAEELLAESRLDVPASVVRLATIVADNETGVVTAHNAVHNTLKLLRHGLLSLMPGDPSTPVYLITGEFAARALGTAVDSRAQGCFHAAHRAEDSLTLGEALDIAFEVFSRDLGFTARRVRRPRFADLTSFGLLAEGASSFGGSVLGQALDSLLPFARQLYVTKDVQNESLRRLLPTYRPDDAATVLAASCARLLGPREAVRVPA